MRERRRMRKHGMTPTMRGELSNIDELIMNLSINTMDIIISYHQVYKEQHWNFKIVNPSNRSATGHLFNE